MKTFTTIAEVRLFIRNAKFARKRIGFVPTMGALHEGHLSLVRASKNNADITIVSIFVNPTQFGPEEDYETYQRNLERDAELCLEEGVDVIFAPSVIEMYPGDNSVVINETLLSRNLCGRSRKGHFSGVLTVVAKLFNIIQPNIVFFGQKDAQQVRIIQQMICDLNYNIEMNVVPTVRDSDGLALSSRNANLTVGERKWAPTIYKALQKAVELYRAGERNVLVLRESVESILISDNVDIEYIEFVAWNTLEPVVEVDTGTLLAAAIKVGDTRLIDNILFA